MQREHAVMTDSYPVSSPVSHFCCFPSPILRSSFLVLPVPILFPSNLPEASGRSNKIVTYIGQAVGPPCLMALHAMADLFFLYQTLCQVRL